MSQHHAGLQSAELDAPDHGEARLAALRAAGAMNFDPMAMHFLEALARRAAGQPAAVRQVLQARLDQAANSLQERLQQARAAASAMLSTGLERFPQAQVCLQAHAEAGDLPALQRELFQLNAQAQRQTLAALTRELEQVTARHTEAPAPRTELKTVSTARTTWSRLSADKQVAKALAQAPQNAGPINSHMLMLRSLELMREISPDYLHRFITYSETLLRLENAGVPQTDAGTASASKPGAKSSSKANDKSSAKPADKAKKRTRKAPAP